MKPERVALALHSSSIYEQKDKTDFSFMMETIRELRSRNFNLENDENSEPWFESLYIQLIRTSIDISIYPNLFGAYEAWKFAELFGWELIIISFLTKLRVSLMQTYYCGRLIIGDQGQVCRLCMIHSYTQSQWTYIVKALASNNVVDTGHWIDRVSG